MAEAKQTADRSAVAAEADQFAALLQKEFKPKTDRARAEVERAVQTLAEQALRETAVVSDDVVGTIKAIIAEIDKKLTDQVNLILHNERFQQLESAWRGLHYLVNNTETDEMLKIRVHEHLEEGSRQDAQEVQGRRLGPEPALQEALRAGVRPAGRRALWLPGRRLLFRSHARATCELLGQMAQVAAAAHAPFIAGGGPTLMGMDSWQELANPRDLAKIFAAPDYAAWRSLRESDDAKYVGLAMPRFLARLPYGAKTNPVEEFEFEEETGGGDHTRTRWANCRLRDGGQHQPLVQALRLVLVDPRRGVRRRGRRACRCTPSRATTAAWT